MVKKSKANKEEAEVILPIQEDIKIKVEPNFTHVSWGIFKDLDLNQWCLARIVYDPSSQKAGIVEKIPCGPSKETAVEKFKIQVGQTLLKS